MLIPFLIAKIHRAQVTGADINYNGSISIDEEIMEKAQIRHFQQVDVYDISNGNRFTTYAIPAPAGSRAFIINGAAAHLTRPGNQIIVAAYGLIDERELNSRHSITLLLDDANAVEKTVTGRI